MFENKLSYHTLIVIIIVIASWIIGRILTRTKTTLDDKIIEVIRRQVTLLSVIIGFSIAIEEVRKALTADHITHNSYPHKSVRAFVDVGVIYGTDIEKAQRILFRSIGGNASPEYAHG
jgi:hypothetical protein